MERETAIRWGVNYPSVKKMIDLMRTSRRRRSESTIKNYCQGVKVYTEMFLGLDNPDLALNKTDFETIDQFIDWCLEERKIANKTLRNYFYGIQMWLISNEIQAEFLKKIDLPSGTAIIIEDRAPSKEELRQIMNFAKIRDKTVIEIAISSGLRVGTLATLKWGDVVLDPRTLFEDTPQEHDHLKVPALVRVKAGMGRKIKERSFFSFITPEAKKVLLQYKELRERQGEIITNESPLITLAYRDKTKTVSWMTIEKAWERLLKLSGTETERKQKWHELHFHTLRKFFETQCIGADVKRPFMEFWMGHKGVYLDESYFRANLQEHLREYGKAIPYLSVFEVPESREERLKRKYKERHPELSDEEIDRKVREFLDIEVERYMTEMEKTELEPLEPLTFTGEEAKEDCQKIVSEAQLESYLAKGWKVQAVLPSGKVVIER